MGPLFKPFRSLGYITDAVPFAVRRTPKDHMVFTAIGKTWQARLCDGLLRSLSSMGGGDRPQTSRSRVLLAGATWAFPVDATLLPSVAQAFGEDETLRN